MLFFFFLNVELKSKKRAEFVQSPFIDAEGVDRPLGLSNLPSDKIRGAFETKTDRKREQDQDVDKNLLCGLSHWFHFWASLKCGYV